MPKIDNRTNHTDIIAAKLEKRLFTLLITQIIPKKEGKAGKEKQNNRTSPIPMPKENTLSQRKNKRNEQALEEMSEHGRPSQKRKDRRNLDGASRTKNNKEKTKETDKSRTKKRKPGATQFNRKHKEKRRKISTITDDTTIR